MLLLNQRGYIGRLRGKDPQVCEGLTSGNHRPLACASHVTSSGFSETAAVMRGGWGCWLGQELKPQRRVRSKPPLSMLVRKSEFFFWLVFLLSAALAIPAQSWWTKTLDEKPKVRSMSQLHFYWEKNPDTAQSFSFQPCGKMRGHGGKRDRCFRGLASILSTQCWRRLPSGPL